MTYTSYDEASAEIDDYTEELPLDERFKQTPVPLIVIFGAEDQIFDAELSIEGYSGRPGRPDRADRGRGPRPAGRKARRGGGAARRLRVPRAGRGQEAPQAVGSQEADKRRRSQQKTKKKGKKRGRTIADRRRPLRGPQPALRRRRGVGPGRRRRLARVPARPADVDRRAVRLRASRRSCTCSPGSIGRPDGQAWVDGTEITGLSRTPS